MKSNHYQHNALLMAIVLHGYSELVTHRRLCQLEVHKFQFS